MAVPPATAGEKTGRNPGSGSSEQWDISNVHSKGTFQLWQDSKTERANAIRTLRSDCLIDRVQSHKHEENRGGERRDSAENERRGMPDPI